MEKPIIYYKVVAHTHPVAGDTPVATVTSFAFRGPNQLVCDWVAALDVGGRYRVVPSRSADGVRWFAGEGHDCSVVAHG